MSVEINWDALREAANDAMSKAYVPYSKFKVGAAALTEDGRIVAGCNVENASYGLTLCAECALVSQLFLTGGGRLVAFTCVDGHGNILMPCGRCRQLLFEHSAKGMILETVSGFKTIDEVIPDAFGPRDLEVMSEFAAVELIMQKREKGELSTAQIDWLIANYTTGVVADEQMSAMAMAILLNGMSRREIKDLTMAMIASGETLNYAGLAWPTSDKHSTGGVGDKITLPLAPLVAAFGVAVPQLSGRGLGHTGGTLDKLESIKGWRAALSNEEFHKQLADVGAVICAAGAGLAPADKKLYALRDVTGTVEAIPLIASSIMSKKIAEGTSSLVLDVKVGSGAFMKNIDRARELATVMVQLGQDAGVNTSALITDMSTPLGLEIGNALEVKESVEVLAGGGPADVVELTVELAREMLRLAGKTDVDVAAALKDGRAMDKWRQMISAQGGDPDAALPVAKEHQVVLAPADGVLTELDALQVGTASWRLGAGRARKEDPVQFGAGITLHAQLGSAVKAGQPLMTLHTDEAERFERAMEALEGSFKIEAAATPSPRKILLDRIDG